MPIAASFPRLSLFCTSSNDKNWSWTWSGIWKNARNRIKPTAWLSLGNFGYHYRTIRSICWLFPNINQFFDTEEVPIEFFSKKVPFLKLEWHQSDSSEMNFLLEKLIAEDFLDVQFRSEICIAARFVSLMCREYKLDNWICFKLLILDVPKPYNYFDIAAQHLGYEIVVSFRDITHEMSA